MGRHSKPSSSSINVAKIAVTGAVIGTGSIGMAAAAGRHRRRMGHRRPLRIQRQLGDQHRKRIPGRTPVLPSTWMSYEAASSPSAAHLASRDQQIAIGEKVLAGQGRGRWPVCGRGLSGPTRATCSTRPPSRRAPRRMPLSRPPPPSLQTSPPNSRPSLTSSRPPRGPPSRPCSGRTGCGHPGR